MAALPADPANPAELPDLNADAPSESDLPWDASDNTYAPSALDAPADPAPAPADVAPATPTDAPAPVEPATEAPAEATPAPATTDAPTS